MKLTKYNYTRVFNLKLGLTTKAVLDHVLSYANVKGIAYPSQERIGQELGICRQTVAKYMKIVEGIKINGKPFIIVNKKRRGNGEYYYNQYVFPWIIAPELYVREHMESIIERFQNEYIEMVIEEDFNNHHVNSFNISNNRQNTSLSLDQIKQLMDKLSTNLGLKHADVLQVLCNVGFEIKQNKTQIYHLEKYLAKSLKKAGTEKKTKEILEGVYLSLFGKDEDALFYMNWQGLAAML